MTACSMGAGSHRNVKQRLAGVSANRIFQGCSHCAMQGKTVPCLAGSCAILSLFQGSHITVILPHCCIGATSKTHQWSTEVTWPAPGWGGHWQCLEAGLSGGRWEVLPASNRWSPGMRLNTLQCPARPHTSVQHKVSAALSVRVPLGPTLPVPPSPPSSACHLLQWRLTCASSG